MQAVPAATIVVVSATTRRNVYPERQWREQDALFHAIGSQGDWRERMLTQAWLHPRPSHLRAFGSATLLRALAMRWAGRIALRLGIDPEALYCYVQMPRKWGLFPSRGALIRELYRRRGLAPWRKM